MSSPAVDHDGTRMCDITTSHFPPECHDRAQPSRDTSVGHCGVVELLQTAHFGTESNVERAYDKVGCSDDIRQSNADPIKHFLFALRVWPVWVTFNLAM